MRKKAYIDPITDYLLHDPDHISSRGAVGRGATTLSGILGGGYLAHKGADMMTKLTGPITGKSKILAMLGAAGIGGTLGHGLGDKMFKYNDSEKITKGLRRISEQLAENNKIALKTLENSVPKNVPEKINNGATSLWNKVTSALPLRPKSNYEKFKDSGEDLLEAMKSTGANGWEALKDVVS